MSHNAHGKVSKFEDTSVNRVKKQKEAIKSIRHGNELLKSDLAWEARESRFITNPSAAAEIHRLQDQADIYAKKTEQDRRKIQELDRQIAATQARVLEQRQKMGGLNASQENNEMIAKQIRTLENRLDKALVKFNESLAMNKNLRERIDTLRRERVVFDSIYKKLERELHEKKKEMAAIISDSNNAYHARDKAQSEMMALRQQAEKDRAEFDAEWKELGKLIAQDRKLRETLRQRQLDRSRDLRAEGESARDGDEENRLMACSGGEEWGAGAKDRQQTTFSQPEQSYEAAFNKIKEATGMTNVSDMVNNFLQAEEKNFSLFNFVNELNSEIERLELMIAETKNSIEKYKGQGVSTDTQRKKVLRGLEEQLSITEGKADEYEGRYQTAMKTINQLKTGIHSIFSRIGAGSNSSVEEMLGNQGVTESNMMQYLGIIEQRTSEILQAYAASQQMTQAVETQGFTSPLEGGTADATVPLRLNVQPPAWDDFSSGEDSDQEDDERPLTREELKRKTLRGGGPAGGANAIGAGGAGGGGAAGHKSKDGKQAMLSQQFPSSSVVVQVLVRSKSSMASSAEWEREGLPVAPLLSGSQKLPANLKLAQEAWPEAEEGDDAPEEPLSEEDLGVIEALLDIPDLTEANLDVEVKSWADGSPVGTISLAPDVFGVPVRRDVVHDVVRWQLAKRRSGNGQTKRIAEVSGSGRKVRPQKGGGIARAGHSRPPHWRGGAKAHGPRRRDFSFKLNKKFVKLGLRVALSARLREGQLMVFDELTSDSFSTAKMIKTIKARGMEGDVTFVVGADPQPEFLRSTTNIVGVKVLAARGANVYDIIKRPHLVLSQEASRTRISNMVNKITDPLSYATDADHSILEEIARLDGLRDNIRADQESYLDEHPEIATLLSGFIRAVVEKKPTDIFAFARQYVGGADGSIDAVVVAGPSGAGKGTIIRRLMELFPNQFGFGCSHTTRDRREGEQDGVHYHFSSLESMREAVARGDFIEHAEVHGNLYGTSVAAVADVTRRGQVCLLDIDVQGVRAVKMSSLRPKFVFIAPPSLEVLETRLRNRGTEDEESLATRLHNAREEIEYGNAEGNFELVIENDDLERAVDTLSTHLVEWFPKIKPRAAAIEGKDQDKAH
eukprot:g11015.t1